MTHSPTLFALSALRRFTPFFVRFGPPSFRRFLLKLVPHQTVKKIHKIVDVMDKTSTEIFETKKLALQNGDEVVLQQVGHGKDIMSILCKRLFPTILSKVCAHLRDSKSEPEGNRSRPPSRIRAHCPNDVRSLPIFILYFCGISTPVFILLHLVRWFLQPWILLLGHLVVSYLP